MHPMSDAPPRSPSSALPEPSPTEHGGRVELRLIDSNGASNQVCYAARWFTEGQRLEGTVQVTPSVDAKKPPAIDIQGPSELPDWLAAFTTTLVRTTARSASCEDPSNGSWPRRLTRWRAAP